jgi:hypothetical protein
VDLKATDVPPGIDWSQLSEAQKQVIDSAMVRFLPISHNRELMTKHWYQNRRLVAFYQGAPGKRSPWRLVYQLDGTKLFRVVCDVNPETNEVSWWVGRIQFQPVSTPVRMKLPDVQPESEVATTMSIQSPTRRPGLTKGAH